MDAVVCGHDRDYVGLLAWMNVGAAREIAGQPEAELDALMQALQGPRVRARADLGLNGEHPA